MDEIKRLIESRQIEAVKKQLTQKLLCIVRNLGQPIYGEAGYGTGSSSNSFDSDAWLTEEERNEDELPTASDDRYSNMGFIYDALQRGHNFEIRYLDSVLRANYNGFTVYLEEDNKIKAYIPHQIWEKLTNDLYDHAKTLDESRKLQNKEEEKAGFMKKATKFLKELRESWGV